VVSFRRPDRDRVASGEITVTYRLWKSAHVKAGKTYPTGFGMIAVDDVRVLPAALVSQEDVPASGCTDIPAIWALAGEHTGTEVGPDTLLFRVKFRFLGDVPRGPEAPSALSLPQLRERLARMDQRSARGSWTESVLGLIDSAPFVPARILAAQMDWETLDFKAHVRRLKRLGLTISHEVGYELSDGGKRYLASL
jgi:hypothetical protein